MDIFSPIAGKVVPLSEVKDKAFAEKMMGEGIAVIPSEGKIFAPSDGTVDTLCDTFHAVGIHTDLGADILIHIGRDTVELNGKYFKACVKEGDPVKKGDLLIKFDMKKIVRAGYDIVTPITVINTSEYTSVQVTSNDEVAPGDVIFEVKK